MPLEVDPSQVHSIEVDPSQVTAASAAPASAVSRFASNLGQQFNPMPLLHTLSNIGNHPVDGTIAAVTGALDAQAHVGDEAVDSFKKGDYATGVKHALLYLLPLVGPQMDQLSNQAADGDVAGALGGATGAGLLAALPDAPALKAAASKAVQVLPKFTNPNAVERAAADFGNANDIPVSAATATGNKFVAGAQKLADHTPIGSVVAQKSAADEAAAFTRVGNELAGKVNGTTDAAGNLTPGPAVVPTQAGSETTDAVEKVISKHSAEANKNYSALRALENDPINRVEVQTGTKQVPTGALDESGQPLLKTVPVTEEMGLPTDLRAAKESLRPIYQQMTRQLPVTQINASAGLKAMKNILDGPDFAPASQVDMDLGTIKGIARGADLPELKDISQGLASKSVTELERAVQEAVSKARRPGTPGAAAAASNSPTGVTTNATNAGATAAGASSANALAGVAPTASASDAAENVVKIPGQAGGLPARYQVQELSSLKASHNGLTFEPNPDYPLTNDRDYTNQVNQGKIVAGSSKAEFDPVLHITDNPDATNGPMVVDSDGNVLGGNGRKMILDRVHAQNPEGAAAYRALLEKKAAQFGIDPQELAGMKQPVLTRVLDDDAVSTTAAKQNAVTDLNKVGTAALTPSERAIADSRRVSQDTLENLAARLDAKGGDSTLAQVLEGKSGNEVFQKLIDDGVIAEPERAGLQTENGLNKAGKERISNLVLGRFFQDPAQLDNLPALLRTRLENIAAPLARVEGHGEWSLTPQMQEAMGIIERARTNKNTLADSLSQRSMFGEAGPSPQAEVLARKLQTSKVADLKAAARQYAGEADYASNGGDLFGNNPTPKESFEKSFGTAPAMTPEETAAASAPAAMAAPASSAAAPAAAAPKGPYQLPVNTRGVAAGADAAQLLRAGRDATVAKYDAADILKSLPTKGVEGRQVFDAATWANDAGIERLKNIARVAPDALPKLGRAYLEHLFEKATAEGGFGKSQTLLSKWQSLGPETKKLLFKNPQLRQDLDNFFMLAKKSAEHPNPSGSALVGSIAGQVGYMFVSPATGVPMVLGAGALAKMLHSPAGVRALTEGLKLPVGAAAAHVASAARVLKAAAAVGATPVPASSLGLAAENSQTPHSEQLPLVAQR